MYVKFLLIVILNTTIAMLTSFSNHNTDDTAKLPKGIIDKKGFAVLELFTSEGCSSCPPADDLMAKIQQEYKDQPVYLLAFHVDYWDRLGWKDVFGNADYSNRQREYGDRLSGGSLYTPQLVVNGKSEFVGSDEFKIRKAITKALATEHKTSISIQAKRQDDKLVVNYQVSKGPKDSRILVAAIQKSATTKVERGENRGHLLSHVQIVRQLHSDMVTEEGQGNTQFRLPHEFNPQQWEVMAMIQDVSSGEIVTAIRVNL